MPAFHFRADRVDVRQILIVTKIWQPSPPDNDINLGLRTLLHGGV